MNRSVVIRVIVVGLLVSLICSVVALATAPIHSPFLLNEYCPEGSQIRASWERANYQGPGENTLFADCVYPDGTGASLGDVDSGTLFRVYFLFFFVLLLIVRVVLLIRNARKSK